MTPDILMLIVFFFNDTTTTEFYTYLHPLSLHAALPISRCRARRQADRALRFQRQSRRRQLRRQPGAAPRSEEHTSELQSLMRISYAVFSLKKKTDSSHNTSLHVTLCTLKPIQ